MQEIPQRGNNSGRWRNMHLPVIDWERAYPAALRETRKGDDRASLMRRRRSFLYRQLFQRDSNPSGSGSSGTHYHMGDATRTDGRTGRNQCWSCIPIQTVHGKIPDTLTSQGWHPSLWVRKGQIYETDATVSRDNPESSSHSCSFISSDVSRDSQSCQIVYLNGTEYIKRGCHNDILLPLIIVHFEYLVLLYTTINLFLYFI